MKSFFFNAEPTSDLSAHPTGYDREYDADSFSTFFAPFFSTSGVMATSTDACLVYAEENTLKVTPGCVYTKGRMCQFEGNEVLYPTENSRVVCRMNKGADVRGFQLVLLPIEEELVDNADIYDLELAQVEVNEDGEIVNVVDTRTFLRYMGQPPYYPPSAENLPHILWLYTLGFPMTDDQREAVENNPSLMAIYQQTSLGPAKTMGSYFRVFEAEEWTVLRAPTADTDGVAELRVPASEHHLQTGLPALTRELRMRIKRSARDVYTQGGLDEAKTKFVAIQAAALAANQSTPGTYPTAADGHVLLTWAQIQYYFLENVLASASVAESKAEELGFNWQDIETLKVTAPNTLDELLTAAYLPAMGSTVTATLDAMWTFENVQGLRFRFAIPGQTDGFRKKWDCLGDMNALTYGVYLTDVRFDEATGDLVLTGPEGYAGQVLVISAPAPLEA